MRDKVALQDLKEDQSGRIARCNTGPRDLVSRQVRPEESGRCQICATPGRGSAAQAGGDADSAALKCIA